MLELFHWEPNCGSLKLLLALHEKGLDFESRWVDFLALEQYRLEPFNTPEAALSIEGEAAVLVHDGNVIADSFNTLLYLDDAFPAAPLQPAAAVAQWRIQVWARLFAEVLAPAVSTLGCQQHLGAALAGRDRAELARRVAALAMHERRTAWEAALAGQYPQALLEDCRRKVALVLGKVEAALESSDWLLASGYSIADIDLFGLANALPALVPDIAGGAALPRFNAWLERIRARPAVRQALARSRSGHPEQAFAPGPEHSRWG
ncbi:MAG: glutathione S-transferase family protein [Gammaproteobacteria bacterium]|nr:glutathione S-transferase family protein [Gammaproteobacteria bacterium]